MTMFRLNGVPANVRALPILQSASGSNANFNTDLTENLVDVKCQIVAKQASGTPSPDNPLPITTYTEMNVCHSAKNLFNKAITTNLYCDGSMVLRQNANFVSVYIPLANGATYTYKQTEVGNLARYALCKSLNEYDKFYSPSNPTVNNYITSTNFTFTNSANFRYLICTIWRSTDTQTFDEIADTIQLEQGNEATAYEPYNGTTSNIPFGQTVANGVLDITTGKLVITHELGDLKSVIWSPDPNRTGRFYGGLSGRKPASLLLLCDSLQVNNVGTNSLQDNQISGRSDYGSTAIFARIDSQDGKTGAEFKTYVTGMKVLFELATPYEIQLNSINLQALLNENNIWCDTGDTEVKYWMSINKYIGQ